MAAIFPPCLPPLRLSSRPRKSKLAKSRKPSTSDRYVIGVDLGTTNCALASRDASLDDAQARIDIRGVTQVVNPGEVAERPLLPSFLYLPGDLDFPAGSTALPWDPQPTAIVGELARKRGAENPVRLVASAKSWLSFAGAQRTAPILPWGAPAEVPHISPVDASAAYLRHLAAAFDASVPDAPLAQQDVL